MEPETIPFLKGRKVTLVPFSRSHLEDPRYLAWLNDLEVTKHLGLPRYLLPVPFAEAERYYQANASSATDLFFAVLAEAGGFVGTARLSRINWVGRTAEVGIMIGDRGAQGKGFASEAVSLVVDHAFRALNLRKLMAGAHAENRASLQCFLRLGFRQEGLLREHAYVDGRYVDYVFLGLFQREYQADERDCGTQLK